MKSKSVSAGSVAEYETGVALQTRSADRRRPLQAGRVEPEVSLARPKLKVRLGAAHALRVGSSRPVRAQGYQRSCRSVCSPGAPRDISTLHNLSRPSRINPTISCVEMFKSMPTTSNAERLDSSGLRIKVCPSDA